MTQGETMKRVSWFADWSVSRQVVKLCLGRAVMGRGMAEALGRCESRHFGKSNPTDL